MNKLRNMRHKSPVQDDSMPPGEDHVRGAGGGLFNKIKRYSNVSHKLMRRSNPISHNLTMPRKHSPHRSTCGSYDMTGDSSRDLRPEIGAPVLITTTALDIDKITPIVESDSMPKSVIPISSSESETEVFADASTSLNDFGNIQFSFFENGALPGLPQKCLNLSTSTEEGDYEVVPRRQYVPHNLSLQLLEATGEETSISPPLRKNKSKSVSNLQSPSRESEAGQVRRHPMSSVDLPALCDTTDYDDNYDTSGYYNEPAPDDSSEDKENSIAAAPGTHNNKNAWNANMVSPKQQPVNDGEFDDFKRSLSAIILHQAKAYEDVIVSQPKGQEKLVVFKDVKGTSSDSDDEDKISHKSFSSVSCLSDDFDMKSASFEDLKENRQLFLSIDDFNALTKEIHETEEFNNSITKIDQEYCDHRRHLQPNQRRVTLMRNKTNKIHLNLNEKKEKITSAWSGFKHWIDEERGKIKEVVQRHSAMQRVGAHLKSPPRDTGSAEEAVSPRDKSRSFAENEEESVDDLDIAATDENNAAGGGARRDSRRSEERDSKQSLLRQKSKTNSAVAAAVAEVIVTRVIQMKGRRRRSWSVCIVQIVV